jgi:CHASE3 domain sensor protein
MKIHLKASLWLALATLLLALGCSGSIAYFDKTAQAAAAEPNNRVIVDGTQEFLSELNDAETGSRGYRITKGDAFFQPYMDGCDWVSRMQV